MCSSHIRVSQAFHCSSPILRGCLKTTQTRVGGMDANSFAANPMGVCENCLQTSSKASVPSMSLPLENEEAKAWGKPQTGSCSFLGMDGVTLLVACESPHSSVLAHLHPPRGHSHCFLEATSGLTTSKYQWMTRRLRNGPEFPKLQSGSQLALL